MTNSSKYYETNMDNYVGDAPNPQSMELIEKNLDRVMKTYRDYLKWKRTQEKSGVEW